MYLAVFNQPQWQTLTAVAFTLAPSQSQIVGRKQLAARAADNQHIKMERGVDGSWFLTNISLKKKVLYKPKGVKEYRAVRSWPIAKGVNFTIDTQNFTAEVEGDELVLSANVDDTDKVWRFDRINLVEYGMAYPPCYWKDSIKQQVATGAKQLGVNRLGSKAAYNRLSLGGHFNCNYRLAIPGLPRDAVNIVYKNQAYYIATGSHERQHTQRLVINQQQNDQGWQLVNLSLRDATVRIAEGDRLVIGRSYYLVSETAQKLQLRPTRRIERQLVTASVVDELFAQQWQQVDVWGLSFEYSMKATIVFVLLIISGWLFSRIQTPRLSSNAHKLENQRTVWLIRIYSFFGAVSALFFLNMLQGIIWMLFLLAAVQLCWLFRLKQQICKVLAVCCFTLLNLGLLSQIHLGLGGAESHWIDYFNKSIAIATTGLWLFLMLTTGTDGLIKRLVINDYQKYKVLSWFIFPLAGLILILQIAFGNEAGVFGVQPIEAVKTMLIFITVMALTRKLDAQKSTLWYRNIFAYLSPVLLGAVIFVLALFFLHDLSPILLLTLFGLGMSIAWFLAEDNRKIQLMGLGSTFTLITLFVASLLYIKQNPDIVYELPQSDRFSTWAQPELYPHSGEQYLRALNIIQLGNLWGFETDSTSSELVHPGQQTNLVKAMGLPAIQDDFAPAFWLHKKGLVGGVLLLVLQLSLMVCLIRLALVVFARQKQVTGNYIKRNNGIFVYFYLFASAAFIGAHLIVSWGTNIGFMPVMGQPMPFISAAGTHMALFLFPLLLGSTVLADLYLAE